MCFLVLVFSLQPMNHPRPLSWNIQTERLTNPSILRGPCVSLVLLDHINVTLIEADRPAEPGEKPAERKGILESVRSPMHLQSLRGLTDRADNSISAPPLNSSAFTVSSPKSAQT